ncbi:hypothetical protein PCANC_02844 [Puccinia coronata f. sp. avenae]|uniref:Uncharacterized protein n=1 Tax=Puccinia coronata f. sp. avenae TaxID=200324 RepID=A0A2N5W453_9BASI|nr:hypothetical protein PCANC_02844 [Puccinia coronata f. sp. avenae]
MNLFQTSDQGPSQKRLKAANPSPVEIVERDTPPHSTDEQPSNHATSHGHTQRSRTTQESPRDNHSIPSLLNCITKRH